MLNEYMVGVLLRGTNEIMQRSWYGIRRICLPNYEQMHSGVVHEELAAVCTLRWKLKFVQEHVLSCTRAPRLINPLENQFSCQWQGWVATSR